MKRVWKKKILTFYSATWFFLQPFFNFKLDHELIIVALPFSLSFAASLILRSKYLLG